MPRRSDQFDRMLPALALGGVVVLLTALALRRIWCSDFWWQYATGRLIFETGIPHTDVFSFTAVGHRWIELRWLYCAALYGLIHLGGYAAAVFFKWLMLLVGFLLAFTAVADRHRLAGTALLFVAVLGSSERFMVRPELVTYVLFAAFVWIIVRYRSAGGRKIYWLPALQLLWVNAHTLFVLGLVTVGLWLAVTGLEAFWARRHPGRGRPAAAQELSRVALVSVITAAVCLLNPYGLQGTLLPLELFREIRGGVFKEHITEFSGPFAAPLRTAGAFYSAMIALWGISCLLNLRRLDSFLNLLCLAQLYLSVTSIRNVPLFCLAAVPAILQNLRGIRLLAGQPPGARRMQAGRLFSAVIVIAGLGYGWNLATNRFHVSRRDTNQFGLGIAESRYPIRAVHFMKQHNLQGPLFSEMHESSYLLSQGYPVFTDPRLEIYGEEFFADYFRMQRDGSAWRQAVQRYGFSAALLDLQSGVVGHLRRDPSWALVYFDESVALYVRGPQADGLNALQSTQDFARVAADLQNRLAEPVAFADLGLWGRAISPVPYLRLGRFLLSYGMLEQAEPFLKHVAQAFPTLPQALVHYAVLLDKRGDRAEAIRHYRQALAHEPDNATVHFRLGQHYFQSRQYSEALDMMQRCATLEPDNALAWAYLGRIHLAREDTAAALRCTRQALQLDPENVTFLKNAAKIRMLRHEYDQAVAPLNKLVELGQADDQVFLLLASAHLARGAWQQAIQATEEGLMSYPDNSELLMMRQRLLEQAPADSDR